MLQYNFKLILRSLKNGKLISFVTILGLSVGMAATILLFLYVKYELSFDKFNTKYDRNYKLINSIIDDKSQVLDICISLNDTVFSEQIPEIESMVQFYMYGDVTADYSGKRIGNLSQIFADPSVFNTFTFHFIEGTTQNAFASPSSIVLTQQTAYKLFGDSLALGKTIKIENQLFTVSAVVDNWPTNSNLTFDLMLAKSSIPFIQNLGGAEFITYFTLKDGVNHASATEKIRKFYLEELNNRFKGSGYDFDAELQPMSKIHLYSSYQPRVGISGNITIVYIYAFLSVLILAIAIINFINLLTVKYESKTKVISIQKAIGASRRTLVLQALGQSITFAYISLFFAAIIVEFTIPYFSNLVNRSLILSYSEDTTLLLALPLLALVVGVVSGIYPALLLSNSPSIHLLKNLVVVKNGHNRLTTALVVFQFAIAIGLLSCIFIINNQLTYMKSADLGLNPKQVIAFGGITEKLHKSFPAVRDVIASEPNVLAVSGSHHLPGGGCSGQGVETLGGENRNKLSINEYRVRGGYFELLQIGKVEGRFLTDNAEAEQFNLVMNEAAIKALGINDPLNQQVAFNNEPGFRIVGVVKDFHYASLRESIEPIVFRTTQQLSYILVRTSSTNVADVIGKIDARLKEFDSEYLPNHRILENVFRNRYKAEEQSMLLTSLASALAFILALLGLYTLTLFMVNKRIKEIGVRKIVGASNVEIVTMLIWVFSRWILVGFIVAIPISYYVMDRWLNGFAYKVEIMPWPFLSAGLIALVVALLTVGWQAYRAAVQNPVDALKYE